MPSSVGTNTAPKRLLFLLACVVLLASCFTTTTVRSNLATSFTEAGVRVHREDKFSGEGCEVLDRRTYALDADEIGDLSEAVAYIVKDREAGVTDVRLGEDFNKFKGKTPDCETYRCVPALRQHPTDVFGTISIRYWSCPAPSQPR